ncbi:MAG: Unknown protein [uncultured Sulfurovum sp.]|uniref:Uncharacterized protein n=1 Tax=uncultured Sulfurovum sp. TaxID=269237 RepID=A0A6S6SJG6_9BACT|nr:MAG: Unknown protein [uncultured Sulfurovum sp.]
MTIDILQTLEYKKIMAEHLAHTIDYLFELNQEFALVCEVKHIGFEPNLPEDILDTFNDVVMFIINNYAFESAKLEKGYFSFESGFGDQNIGATVHIPILAIQQIVVNEVPILFNLAEHTNIKSLENQDKSISQKNSMAALLKNPKNQKLLKKKK